MYSFIGATTRFWRCHRLLPLVAAPFWFLRGVPSYEGLNLFAGQSEKWSTKRNPELWGDFSQLRVQNIPQSQFEFVPRDTEEFKFNQNLNSNLYREIPRNLIEVLTGWLKFPLHSRFRFAFRWPFRVSSSRERAVGSTRTYTSQEKKRKNRHVRK